VQNWSICLISAAELFLFHRRFLVRIACPGMLALVAGCAARPDSAALEAASHTLARTPPAPAPAPKTSKIVAAREPRKTPPPHADTPVAEFATPQLVGLSEEQLTGLLGTPTARAGDGPGRHLYYRMPQCTLNLSLYPNVDTHIFRLLSYEVTGNDGHDYGKQICRSELAAWLHTRQRARDEIAAGR
jgi:hypothetical protein